MGQFFLNGIGMFFCSHVTNIWLAIAIELYVPAITPISNTIKNSLIVVPPNNNRARRVIRSVKLVLSDLPIVSDILKFTISVNGLLL